MTLQQLIRKALTNPEFRLALETGVVNPADIRCTKHEVVAAATALRLNRSAARSGRGEWLSLDALFGNNVFTLPGWRTGPEG